MADMTYEEALAIVMCACPDYVKIPGRLRDIESRLAAFENLTVPDPQWDFAVRARIVRCAEAVYDKVVASPPRVTGGVPPQDLSGVLNDLVEAVKPLRGRVKEALERKGAPVVDDLAVARKAVINAAKTWGANCPAGHYPVEPNASIALLSALDRLRYLEARDGH